MNHSLALLLVYNGRRRWNQGLRVLTGRGPDTKRMQLNPQMIFGGLVAIFLAWIIYSFTYATLQERLKVSASLLKSPTAAGVTTLIHLGLTLMAIGFEGINGFRFKQHLLHARTFPVPIRAVAWQSILETALLNPMILVFAPVLLAIARLAGWGWAGWIPAISLPLLLNYVSAHAQFWALFGIHRWAPRSLIPFLNTFFTVAGLVLILLLVPLLHDEAPIAPLQALLSSGVTAWGPGGLGIKLVIRPDFIPATVFLLWLGGLTLVGGGLLRLALKPSHSAALLESGTDTAHVRGLLRLPYILKLFVRKPQILLQIFFPTFGIFSFLLIGDLFQAALKGTAWGFFAFLMGLIAVITSVPRLILYEGGAFWRMFTYPRSVFGVLLGHAASLGGFIMGLCLAVHAFGIFKRGSFDPDDWTGLVLIGIGLPLATLVCVCAAILGTWPPTSEKVSRIKPGVVALGIVQCLLLVGFYFCPTWFRAGYLAIFALFTLGWWLAADRHLRYFLDVASHVEFDVARLNIFQRLGSMFVQPGETFADLVRAPKPIAAIVLVSCTYFFGNLLLTKATPYTSQEIVREQVERQFAARGVVTPADRQQIESQVKFRVILRRELGFLTPIFVIPFQVCLVTACLFIPGLMFEGINRFGVYVGVVGYSYLAAALPDYLTRCLVLLVKRPELWQVAQGTITATNLGFFAPEKTPLWVINVLQEVNFFSLVFVVVAGYGLAVVNKVRLTALIPICLWIVYLGGVTLLEWIFN